MRSLAPLSMAGLCALALGPSLARAQDTAPFFGDDPESKKDESETKLSGSITSTNFYYQETGAISQPVTGGVIGAENASATRRVFTDLRLQLDAEHISGSDIDFVLDVRGRLHPSLCRPRAAGAMVTEDCVAFQSGTYGSSLYDGREVHANQVFLRSRGQQYDFILGRQFLPDYAGLRIDGLRVDSRASKQWTYTAFAGGYPTRGSRDIRTDYPVVNTDQTMLPGQGPQQRLIPITAGAGGAYKIAKAYGSVGVAGILPRANEQDNNLVEPTRVFAMASGYWQQSDKTDIYHYVVVDVAGSAGLGPTNLSLGINHRPTQSVHAYAQVNRVDTETLVVQAQQRLETPDPNPVGLVQNNIAVSRMAQESARVGLSGAFAANRFEVSAIGAIRRRPEIAIGTINGMNAETVTVPKAQAIDITLQVVDRQSYKDFRIAGNVTKTFSYGDENIDRSENLIVRLSASRPLAESKGEVEFDVGYVQSTDLDREAVCGTDFVTCFGTSASRTITLGALAFYRPQKDWFLIGSASLANMSLTTVDNGVEVDQPSVLSFTGMARLAYRF